MRRIGSRSLGEFPSDVVGVECGGAIGPEAIAMRALWRGLGPTSPCPILLSLNLETSTQALGEEAINLLFEKHRLKSRRGHMPA